MKYKVHVYIHEFNNSKSVKVYEGENFDIVTAFISGYSSAGKYVYVEEC